MGEVVACLTVSGNRDERAGVGGTDKSWFHTPFNKAPFLNSHNLPMYHILMNPSVD